MKQIELLAPAGNLEKLKTAVDFGADAVYFGGNAFSLRAGAGNLSREEMEEGVAYAHDRNRKCHLALNIFPRTDEFESMESFLKGLRSLQLDACIVSDPGVIQLVQEILPETEVHLSTQANTTNARAASFWYHLGVKRVVLARELTLKEIRRIHDCVPEHLELEAFVHGAMCMSYSGRCLLSAYLTGRDANRGACAHPCRWEYALMEKQRPGEYIPVEEDGRGTYFMNSRDLCMIQHLPDLARAGIRSMKIEGRMKSMYYTAVTVGAYRRALDAYLRDPDGWTFDPVWMEELCKASHRAFCTGFYYGTPGSGGQNTMTSTYTRDYTFAGVVREYDPVSHLARIEQRNKLCRGEIIECFGPRTDSFSQPVVELLDENRIPAESVPHAQQIFYLRMDKPVEAGCLLRKQKVY